MAWTPMPTDPLERALDEIEREWNGIDEDNPFTVVKAHIDAQAERIVELEAELARVTADRDAGWEAYSSKQIEYDELFDEAVKLRDELARMREALEKITKSGNLFEHYDLARAALNGD